MFKLHLRWTFPIRFYYYQFINFHAIPLTFWAQKNIPSTNLFCLATIFIIFCLLMFLSWVKTVFMPFAMRNRNKFLSFLLPLSRYRTEIAGKALLKKLQVYWILNIVDKVRDLRTNSIILQGKYEFSLQQFKRFFLNI